MVLSVANKDLDAVGHDAEAFDDGDFIGFFHESSYVTALPTGRAARRGGLRRRNGAERGFSAAGIEGDQLASGDRRKGRQPGGNRGKCF